MKEPNLNPPDSPDMGDPCAECGEEILEEYIYVGLPGPRLLGPIYVCSTECRSEYLQGYADHMMDQHDWD